MLPYIMFNFWFHLCSAVPGLTSSAEYTDSALILHMQGEEHAVVIADWRRWSAEY